MKYLILLFLVSCGSAEYINVEEGFTQANKLGCIELLDVEIGSLKADYVLCKHSEFFKLKDARDYNRQELTKCIEIMDDWRVK